MLITLGLSVQKSGSNLYTCTFSYRKAKEKDEIIDVVSEPPAEGKKRQRTPKGAVAADEKGGKRLKEEKKQEMQQKSQEEVQREDTFKTWLTGLHRRRKVCFGKFSPCRNQDFSNSALVSPVAHRDLYS